jgi:hypothetical protein
VLLFWANGVASEQLQTPQKVIADYIVSLLQCLPSNIQPWFINVQIVKCKNYSNGKDKQTRETHHRSTEAFGMLLLII